MFTMQDFQALNGKRATIREALRHYAHALRCYAACREEKGDVTAEIAVLDRLVERFAPIQYRHFDKAARNLARIASADADSSTSTLEELENLAAQALAYDSPERVVDLAGRRVRRPKR